jgi:hypothetical protein
MTPDYSSLFISSDPGACPLLLFELRDTSDNLLIHPSIEVNDTLSPATSQLQINNYSPFTTTVHIASWINTVPNNLELNVRVCGEETISVVDATKKSFVLGFETGDPASMDNATRYLTIDEATFSAYFAVAPLNDPCIIETYVLFVLGTPSNNLWPAFDERVLLEGSIGSLELKIDKTIASTQPKKFYFSAFTMGIVEAQQIMEFVVCPLTGSASITSPSSTLFASVEQNAAGAAANAAFGAFAIHELVRQCAEFESYEVIADAATSALISYPEPGVNPAT